MGWKVKASGLDDLIAALDPVRVTYMLQQIFDPDLGDFVSELLKHITPGPSIGDGPLGSSIKWQRHSAVGSVEMIWDAATAPTGDAPYLTYLLDGTEPYSMKAAGKDYPMHWTDGGEDIFAWSRKGIEGDSIYRPERVAQEALDIAYEKAGIAFDSVMGG